MIIPRGQNIIIIIIVVTIIVFINIKLGIKTAILSH